MWSATSQDTTAAESVRPLPSLASSDPYLSVGHPFVKMRVSTLPGKGFVITLTDAEKREVTTPTIPFDSIARAVDGRQVIVRNGGFIAELTPVDGFIRVKGGPMAGRCLEGLFRPGDVDAAARSAKDRNLAQA